MTAKEYLSQLRYLDLSINSKLEQKEQLKALATKVSPSSGFGSSGDISDKVGKTAAKIVDLEREINDDIDRLIDLKAEINSAINAIPEEKLRKVLELHYVNKKTWEQVAVELDITYRWVCILHGKALEKIIVPSSL